MFFAFLTTGVAIPAVPLDRFRPVRYRIFSAHRGDPNAIASCPEATSLT
jgi:hypothetical protein